MSDRNMEEKVEQASNSKNISLPMSRVRLIMKSSPDVSCINQDALFLTTKATVIWCVVNQWSVGRLTALFRWTFATPVNLHIIHISRISKSTSERLLYQWLMFILLCDIFILYRSFLSSTWPSPHTKTVPVKGQTHCHTVIWPGQQRSQKHFSF